MKIKSFFQWNGMFALQEPDPVKRQVFGNAHAPRLPVLNLCHLLAAVPDADKHLLDNILGFLLTPQKPQGKAKKLVFSRQYPVFESFEIHWRNSIARRKGRADVTRALKSCFERW